MPISEVLVCHHRVAAIGGDLAGVEHRADRRFVEIGRVWMPTGSDIFSYLAPCVTRRSAGNRAGPRQTDNRRVHRSPRSAASPFAAELGRIAHMVETPPIDLPRPCRRRFRQVASLPILGAESTERGFTAIISWFIAPVSPVQSALILCPRSGAVDRHGRRDHGGASMPAASGRLAMRDGFRVYDTAPYRPARRAGKIRLPGFLRAARRSARRRRPRSNRAPSMAVSAPPTASSSGSTSAPWARRR